MPSSTTTLPRSSNGSALTDHGERIHDLVGIGFGPSNLSLAIAIEEHNADSPAQAISARFVDSSEAFGWHDGMLLPGTTMQVSFLKDLATMRSPRSAFTFVNYLHEHGRLPDFINLKTFYPTRMEFHDYLRWAAAKVEVPVDYGVRVEAISWNGTCFEVSSRNAAGVEETHRARHLVFGLGIEPVLPEGIETTQRVFHNHSYLPALTRLPPLQHRRFVVVGSGQSAAEIAGHLHAVHEDAEVHISYRRFGYTPSDDTPYANRIFDPEAAGIFFAAPEEVKQNLLRYHWPTNYSAVDAGLIEDLYHREYQEMVQGTRRLKVHRVTDLARIEECATGITVVLRDLARQQDIQIEADAAVIATGFRPRDVRALLDPSIPAAFTGELPDVDADYRLRLRDPRIGGIYLNGGVEHSHGLSSSLLSLIAVRAEKIRRSVSYDIHQQAGALS